MYVVAACFDVFIRCCFVCCFLNDVCVGVCC